MARKKRLTDDDLRNDPDYIELGELLDKQTSAQKERLEKRLSEEGQLPLDDPCDESQLGLPAGLVAGLRKLIREEIGKMITCPAAATETQLPPPIPRVKKKYQGERATLPGCRIDKNLADLFEQARVQAGVSASELMQRILWAYFNSPPLSFEEPKQAEESVKRGR